MSSLKVWLHGQTTILRFLICLAIGPSVQCLAKEQLTVVLDPAKLNDWQTMAVWYGYTLERINFREKHKLPLPKSGTAYSTFDEEVDARTFAAQIYQELKDENKGWHNAYWETLLEVKSNGFMAAYVWTYLRQDNWPARARPRDLSAFQTWDQLHLKNHQALTYGALVVEKE